MPGAERLEGGYDRRMKVRIGISTTDKLLEIEVLDHIIIGQGRYVSMKEKNLGFEG